MAEKFKWPGEATAKHSRRFGAKYRKRDTRADLKKALTPQEKRDRWGKRPVTPGSSLTNREVKKSSKAAARLQFGDKLRSEQHDIAEAKQERTDMGGYYDEYLKQLAAHAAATQQIGQTAQAAMTGLQQGVTGLGQTGLDQIKGQAQGDAAARGAQASDPTALANSAAAVRQSLVGSFAGQQAGVNAARSGYAENLAHVTGPTQKLQGMAQETGRIRDARKALTATRGDVGAFKQQYKTETTAAEAKNAAAVAIAGGEQATKNATLAETTRSHKAQERIDSQRIVAETNRAIASAKAATAAGEGKLVTSGAFQGKTVAEIKAMPDSEKRKAIKAYDKAHGSTKKTTDDDKPAKPKLTTNQTNEGRTQVGLLKDLAYKAKRGQGVPKLWKNGRKLSRQEAGVRIRGYAGLKLVDGSLLAAALDAIYNPGGHLSHDTAVKLRAAGFSAEDIASALGVKTKKQWQQAMIDANTQAAAGHGLPAEVGHQ